MFIPILSESHTYVMNSVPRGYQESQPITNTCTMPTNTVIVDLTGSCIICYWDTLLPISVGNVLDFNTLDEVWNSPTAKQIQQDVSDKKFTWCAVNHCGIKVQNKTRPFARLSINIDESCNLQCPSCRRHSIMHTSGPLVERKIEMVSRIQQWLDVYDKPIEIVMSGNGDVLASTIMRPFIKSFIPKDNHMITLFTNGHLIKKQLKDTAILSSISKIMISVDAGTAGVYNKVRIGGNWDNLLENLRFVKQTKANTDVSLMFAIQRNNYRDLHAFAEMCASYGFVGNCHSLEDWGTWAKDPIPPLDAWTIEHGTFADNDVLNSSHPEYNDCKKIVNGVRSEYPELLFSYAVKDKLGILNG